jgi:hypothetical protein
MATGAVTYKLTDMRVNETGPQIEVHANATKYVEDEDGALQSIGSWTGKLSYAKAGFGARTFLSVRNDIIAEIKAKNAAVENKTIL